ncbi:MAG: endonuclease, partial [Muribaculaceae bacterium]|nr:endonuclease [Muribaculaceae bacterium]
YFYFATRYMARISSYTSGTGSTVFTTSTTLGHLGLTTWAINQLLEWHRNDPVSTLETTRNDAVYGIQHNRNPFVDNPELVEYLWGNMQGQVWNASGTNTPVLTAPSNGSTVNVGTNTGNGVSKTINVSGSNLTKALTVSVSGTGFTVTPTSITATNANAGTTVTVTYNGTATNATGSLTFSSSEVSTTVNLTASYNSGVGPTPGDEVIETWEGCASGGYWTQEVQGAAFKWYFSNAGLYARDNDHWNGSLGCCFGKNADSYIQMSEDYTDGASKVAFYAANYGSDAAPTIKVQYSTNSGSTWTDLATCSLNSTWKQYSYDLNVTGNVRFKFVQTAGSRLNIDDIAITSNSGAVTNPQLTAPTNGSTVNVGTIAATGTSVSKTITVRGSDLTKALNVSVSGTGFSVSPTSISAANANAGTTVTVTYTSNTPGDATGTLTISSSEASVTVNLTASKIAMPSISITPLSPLEAEQNGASTIVSGTVSADDNNEAITLSVDGNFELSLNRTDWSTALTLDPSGEVFYLRLASTANVGDYYGEVSASTSLVSAYADVEGSVIPKPVQLGDVDKDGHVTVADVAALIQYLLLGSPSDTTIDIDAADVSQDGSISVGDVSALINYLLTAPTLTQARVWEAYPAQNGIVIENPAEEELEVYDFEGNCIASAFSDVHISLPAGINVVASDTSSRKVVVK